MLFHLIFFFKFFVIPKLILIFASDQASSNCRVQTLEYCSLATERNARMSDDHEGRAGQKHFSEIQRLRSPFVRTAKGKGRFRTLPVCVVKSRKFESFHSGNATKRLREYII